MSPARQRALADLQPTWCDTVDYARMTAAQVVATLPGLSARDLAEVEERELSGKRRVTVLRRIEVLQKRFDDAPLLSPPAPPAAGFDPLAWPAPPPLGTRVELEPAGTGPAPEGWVEAPERSRVRPFLLGMAVVVLVMLVAVLASHALR